MLDIEVNRTLSQKYKARYSICSQDMERLSILYTEILTDVFDFVKTKKDKVSMFFNIGNDKHCQVKHIEDTTIVDIEVESINASYRVSIIKLPTGVTVDRNNMHYPTELMDQLDIREVVNIMLNKMN